MNKINSEGKIMSNIPKTHLFTEDDLHLYELNQIFLVGSIWLEKGMGNYIGTFDLLVRDLPPQRNFLLFGGLEEIVTCILRWRYTEDEANYLLRHQIVTKKFAQFLKDFKFTGDLWAMPEGTVFLPNEPVLRITAPLIEANLFSMFLMNALVSNTIFLSKFIRVVMAARPQVIFSSGIRAHSFESAMKAARAQYLAGVPSIAASAFFRKYNLDFTPIPPTFTAYHAYVQSFPTEIEAMRAAAEIFPDQVLPIVDTYDNRQGIENAIKVAKELKKKGRHIEAIMLDSGDLAKWARLARKRLDEEDLKETKITLASNIDEYKIAKFKKQGVPADYYIVVTEAVTSADAPKLEAVYKLAEVNDGRTTRPTVKLSEGKMSLPGRKQVFRQRERFFKEDIIGFEDEKLGEPLLVPVIKKGKLVYKLPSLDQIKFYVQEQVGRLSPKMLDVHKQYNYPVKLSNEMNDMLKKLRKLKI